MGASTSHFGPPEAANTIEISSGRNPFFLI